MRRRTAESFGAIRAVSGNGALRKLLLAGALEILAQWGGTVAFGIYAYEHGGAKAVGLLTLVRAIPAALAAPFLAGLADRYSRTAAMVGADVARTVALAGAGAVMASGGPAWAAYAFACLSAVGGTAFAPAEAATMPSLARTPDELAAANVAMQSIDAVGTFAGPALAGLLLAVAQPGIVFLAGAGVLAVSTVVVAAVRVPPAAVSDAPEQERAAGSGFLAGFSAIGREPALRTIVGLYAAQTLAAGAFTVLVVVLPLQLLHTGSSGVGYLSAASGLGGIVGAAAAFALVGRRRLGGDLGRGIVLWAGSLAVVGLWPRPAVALVLLGLLGAGETIVDSSVLTLLQRAAPPEALARVFGVLRTVLVASLGIGAAVTPLLVDRLGVRVALLCVAAFVLASAAVGWRRLVAVDRAADPPLRALELLRGIPIFAPLAPPALEQLAARLEPLELPGGADVIREGEHGDRFYVVEAGSVEVSAAGRTLRTLGPGEFFGEIALLRDVPRTATVRTATDVLLRTLERDAFLDAVAASPGSTHAAEAVIGARLAVGRPPSHGDAVEAAREPA